MIESYAGAFFLFCVCFNLFGVIVYVIIFAYGNCSQKISQKINDKLTVNANAFFCNISALLPENSTCSSLKYNIMHGYSEKFRGCHRYHQNVLVVGDPSHL